MDPEDRLALAVREIAKADVGSESEDVLDGGSLDLSDRYYEKGRKTARLKARERTRWTPAAPGVGAWVCLTWLCSKCGTRMWSERLANGLPGWFGGGQPGCCW